MKIRVIDLETTGFAPPAGVCDIGWTDLASTQTNLVGEPCGYALANSAGVLCSPGQPIPPETSAIHHITDEDVAGAPFWGAVAASVLSDGDVFAAHNAKFEQQWLLKLSGKRPWVCTYKVALRLFPNAPSHSNQTLRYVMRPAGLDRSIANVAHRAMPDAYVTAHLLRDMLALASVEEMIAWTNEPALLIRCHVGAHRGKLWADVDSGFMSWILGKDFDEDVKFTCRHHLKLRETAA